MRKKDRHFLYAMQQSALDAERESAYQARKAAEKRLEFDKQVHEDTLKVKDRVDLSLSQYEEMKSKISVLEDQVRRQQAVLEAIGINPSLVRDIIPNSTQVSTGYSLKDNVDTVRIEFECYRNLNWESIVRRG